MREGMNVRVEGAVVGERVGTWVLGVCWALRSLSCTFLPPVTCTRHAGVVACGPRLSRPALALARLSADSAPALARLSAD